MYVISYAKLRVTTMKLFAVESVLARLTVGVGVGSRWELVGGFGDQHLVILGVRFGRTHWICAGERCVSVAGFSNELVKARFEFCLSHRLRTVWCHSSSPRSEGTSTRRVHVNVGETPAVGHRERTVERTSCPMEGILSDYSLALKLMDRGFYACILYKASACR